MRRLGELSDTISASMMNEGVNLTRLGTLLITLGYTQERSLTNVSCVAKSLLRWGTTTNTGIPTSIVPRRPQ